MVQKAKNPFILTALALYFTYFIHGIGVSILAQYKSDLVAAWGESNLGLVIRVSAALGLGCLISLPFSGVISDKFGRKTSGLIGIAFYVLYFIGVATSTSMWIAYAFAVMGGIANSFLDTCVTPSILEIFKEKGAVANMFTKFSISIGQLVLPFCIGIVSGMSLPYTTLFYLAGILIALDGLLIIFLKFPKMNADAGEKAQETKMKFDSTAISLILIGLTCTATFQLWLNCNQELGKMYGLANPRMIQTMYAAGTICAVLFTALVVLKKLKPVDVLVLYPAISFIMLLVTYFIKTPTICLVAGFVIGYAGAGGVLQLAVSTANELFPTNKGKITSIVMISSSVANYVILEIAGYITKASPANGPVNIVLFNAGITLIGVLLALYVRKQFKLKLA
ncbi:transporter, major facilitator family protein [Gemella bergeri ATCC 700627]|uniref:Transporter, major facilitator family protein n=1 Tax=Gemella bergeri ATCC 700627 TaxID=1321820 RepID=U2S251_9BACL|nr:MFS transporter [Gemella bergeri]ERK56887.1 transporter, major facilitator family protein [Gemella bergeri ATCC 700627]